MLHLIIIHEHCLTVGTFFMCTDYLISVTYCTWLDHPSHIPVVIRQGLH